MAGGYLVVSLSRDFGKLFPIQSDCCRKDSWLLFSILLIIHLFYCRVMEAEHYQVGAYLFIGKDT